MVSLGDSEPRRNLYLLRCILFDRGLWHRSITCMELSFASLYAVISETFAPFTCNEYGDIVALFETFKYSDLSLKG